MKPFAFLLSICIAASAFSAQDACAAVRAYLAIAATPVPGKSVTAHPSAASDQGILKAARRSKSSKAAHKKPPVDKHHDKSETAHAVTHATIGSRDGLAEQKTVAREHAERKARSEAIYRTSQVSAPIITNATACKRIGAHGESIYENCELSTATNRTGGM